MEGGEETDTELGDFERMSIVSSESDDDAAVKYAGGEEPREELRTTRPDLSAYASQTPMHEGMVFKIGGRKGPRRILKRYFVLYPGVILYYHHRTSYARDKKRGLVSSNRPDINNCHPECKDFTTLTVLIKSYPCLRCTDKWKVHQS